MLDRERKGALQRYDGVFDPIMTLVSGIRYVVDAGRAKEKVMDSHGAAARFQVAWISKASAEQRAGRAGRTGPGHAYR